jgi:cation diffusion facilitator family transporter
MVNTIKINHSMQVVDKFPTHHQVVNRVLWQVLGLNIVVAGAKLMAGMLAGSISMIADGFHSAMDASSNIIGLIGSTIADRPPDEDHPYGHQKYETFATLGIGLLLLLTSWNVLQSIFNRLVAGNQPEITTLSFVVMIVTILINLAVTTYEHRRGLELKSNLLLADAAHTKSDIFVSLSVLISLVAIKFGLIWVDILVALTIVLVIGHAGWKIVRRASNVLADSVMIDPVQVEHIVLSVDGVQSCHKIRSRGTEQAVYLDLHIQVDGDMTLENAHGLGHVVQNYLKQELEVIDVLVHVEPTV